MNIRIAHAVLVAALLFGSAGVVAAVSEGSRYYLEKPNSTRRRCGIFAKCGPVLRVPVGKAGLIITLCFMLAADFASAQNQLGESAREVAQRNSKLVRTDLGLVPQNLEDLVEASPVIVQGIYGPLLETRYDRGEGRTVEQLVQQLKLSVEQVEQMGFPMATYQFNVSAVLKGSNLLGEGLKLEFEFVESEDAYDVLPWLSEYRTGEHLLFLDVASNGKLYIRGQVFDMKLQDEKYIFRFGQDFRESTGFGSEDAQLFLRSIDRLVE